MILEKLHRAIHVVNGQFLHGVCSFVRGLMFGMISRRLPG